MNRRNLSGIYIFHQFDDDPKQKPTCFEDCPVDKQDEWLASLDEDALRSLAKMLAETIRRLGEEFDIISE